jgi:hypothetical protein
MATDRIHALADPALTAEPLAVARLPKDRHGRPVPWFVAWIDGQPDFRIARGDALADAQRFGLCWVCGQPRGRHAAFVVGPMCAVNRVSAEPPSHLPCAVYSATHCPFLITPRMGRRDKHQPEGVVDPAGTMLRRNPGVALVWSSRTWRTKPDGMGGVLFDLAEPTSALWFAEGRPATHAEVDASIQSGMPLLMDLAVQEGPRAVTLLAGMAQAVLPLMPAPAAGEEL